MRVKNNCNQCVSWLHKTNPLVTLMYADNASFFMAVKFPRYIYCIYHVVAMVFLHT